MRGTVNGQRAALFRPSDCSLSLCLALILAGYSTPPALPQQSAGGLQVDFESVFGAKASGSNSLSSDGEGVLASHLLSVMFSSSDPVRLTFYSRHQLITNYIFRYMKVYSSLVRVYLANIYIV